MHEHRRARQEDSACRRIPNGPSLPARAPTLATLLPGYVLPLAGVSAIGSLIGSVLSGLSIMGALSFAITGLVGALVGVVMVSFIIDALAPTFGAEKSSDRAGKVAAYAGTAGWVAGVFQIIPVVGGLIAMLGGLYSLYLLYLGLLRVMKSPPDKAVAYTIVVVVVAIVVVFAVVFYLARMLGLNVGMMPAYTLD